MTKYDHTEVEKKWQGEWAKEKIYKTGTSGKNKRYILDMFPYPSGASMHVGHLEGYVGTDILSRYYRMNACSVLHPMGWDAFGLPAENYAIKTGIHPDKSTHDNISTFKRQLMSSGLSYDWDYEIDTSSPEFYKWTQWIFISMFKKGLAYKKKAPVNWCPKDETVLANEQVVEGKCERCDTVVIQKELDQWFLKITDYADKLISGLEDIDWPDEVKRQQINWIGKSEGRIIEFKIEGSDERVKVYTTRPDTLNSATFIAVASRQKQDTKEKWGKFTGKYAINPLNNEKLPIWETNYVEETYGTGAIMGVPAYDERDREFAKKYKIGIVERVFTDKILGEKTVNYHLRDWLISRQRYWGCPIPMVYCKEHQWQPVNEKDLPVMLPADIDFQPHGESPLARSESFQKDVVCPICGKTARREVDTMDTYIDSSWYFIRFVDPKNDKELISHDAEKWLPVDEYVGGGHVVQHLLFARFFWKFMRDSGLIDKSLGDEPFLKLRAPGWILGADLRKMSKRWGNVVTPDDIIPKFGADTLRVYEMFMGPFDVAKPWSMTGVEGANRFLGRVWRLYQDYGDVILSQEKDAREVLKKLHQTIKKVGDDIPEMKFNTAISAMMELVNLLYEKAGDRANSQASAHPIRCAEWDEALKSLCLILAPFAPHMSEELWVSVLRQPFSIHRASWPSYNAEFLTTDEAIVIIQVDGKVRGQLTLNSQKSLAEDKIVELAKKDEKVKKWLDSREIKNIIFVSGKLVNFVTK